MERIANRISVKIAQELKYSKEQQEVIEYGLIALLQTVTMIMGVLILGAILGIFAEAAAVCFGVSILRRYSGGAHASSILSCTILSALLCIGFAFAGRYLAGLMTSGILAAGCGLAAFLFAAVTVIRKVPVDSPNKPITSPEKKRRLKIRTAIVLLIYLAVSAGLFLCRSFSEHALSVYACLLIAITWQMGTLTEPGRLIVEGSDRLIYRMFAWKGGHCNEED